MLAFLLVLLAPLECHPIHSDVIGGQDIASAVPALASLPAELRFGLAPVPGQRRVFRAVDLKRIASASGIPEVAVTDDVCFAWAVSTPDRARMQVAMEEALKGRNPVVQIIDSSLTPAPEGEIVFPLSNLTAGSDRPVVWRGFVRYGGSHQFSIWARVLVTVKEQHVVATDNLKAGDQVGAGTLELKTYVGPIRRDKFLFDLAAASGLVLRCPVAAGSPILETMLEAPREINTGDLVNAIVENGAARLDVQAVAEQPGRKGQIISVRNTRSGRSFHARIESKGIVYVVQDGPTGLVVEGKKS